MTGLMAPLLVSLAVAACGISLADLSGQSTSRQNLQADNRFIHRIGIRPIVGPPPLVSEQIVSEFIELGTTYDLVLFRNPSVVQPKTLQIELLAQRLGGQIQVNYRADILNETGHLLERVKGEEIIEREKRAQSQKTIRVLKGDTLSKLARQHRVTMAQLVSWNNLRDAQIFIGQRLEIGIAEPQTDIWESVDANQRLRIGQKILSAVKTLSMAKAN